MRLRDAPYQVENADGCCLVFSPFGKEEQASSGLTSPGSDGMSYSRELLYFDGLITEVEVALHKAEDPARHDCEPDHYPYTCSRINDLLYEAGSLVA
jgi:hypothetical protein